jgi:hypothetical protein
MSDVAGDDWVEEISPTRGGTPDSPVTQFSVSFLRQSDGRSLAPGMAGDPFNQVLGVFKPFLHPDTEINIDAANIVQGASVGTAVWRRWLEGVVQSVAWPGEFVTCECNSLDFVVEDTDIREEEERGAPDPGTPLPTEIQGLNNRWLETSVTLYTPEDPGAGVGPYKTAVGKVGAQNRALAAQRIAWDVRYLPDPVTQTFRYTLYEPPRDKVTPDLYLSAGEVEEIPGLEETGEHIRNEFTATAKDATGRIFTRHRSTVYPAGSPSYRRRWMGMTLSEDGGPMTVEQVDALLLAAEQDLSKPLADLRLRLPFLPWLGLHDVIELGADSIRFDTPTRWAVVSASHAAAPSEKYTIVEVRGGGPVGQFYRWQERTAASMPDDLDGRSLYDVVEGEPLADGSLSPSWRRGPLVASVRAAADVYALPEKRADWDNLMGKLALLRVDTLRIPPAPYGYYSIAHVEPRDQFLRPGRVWRKTQIGAPPELRAKSLTFPENDAGTLASIVLEMVDPRAVLTGINVYITDTGVEAGPFPALLTGTLTWEYSNIPLLADHPLFIRLEGTRNDGHDAWTYGPVAVDTDKIPGIPSVTQVKNGAAVTLRVDGLDTDTATMYYRPVVAGVMGAEVAILPRDGGTDPRFGAFSVTAGATELRYFIYGKNSAGVGGPVGGYPYKDERVAIYTPPVDTLFARTELHVLPASNDTQTVFEAVTVPSGGTVKLTEVNGSAVRLAGPAIGVSSPSGQQWTIGRGAYNAQSGQVAVEGAVSGYVSDLAFLPIEVVGRDTVPLQLKVEVLSPTATQVTGRLWVADPYPTGNITISYTYTGVGSVSPGTPQTILAAAVTNSLTTTGHIDFTIVLGGTAGRVLFVVSSPNRLTQSDAIDVPARVGEDGIPDVVSIDPAYEGSAAHITTHHDADTWSGVAAGQYRVNGGGSTSFDISSAKVGSFTVTRSATINTLVEVRGSLSGGTWGPWYPRYLDRYDAPPIALESVNLSVEDTGVAGDDVYTLFITGKTMAGKSVEVRFYRSGVQRGLTQTFSITADTADDFLWVDVGAGDSSSNPHYAIVQMFDSATSINYGPEIKSRTVNSFV